MTSKIRKKLEDEYNHEYTEYKEGLSYFRQNCQRQGIELKHNPDDEVKPVKKEKISVQATMMKIRERTKMMAEARKAKN